MKSNVCFIYKNKCHPVTQTYADVIDARAMKITGFANALWEGVTSKVAKYYFIESIMSMIVPIIKRMLGKKVEIIFRGNDGLFGEKTEAYLWTKNPVKKWFLLFLIKNMDGIIVESESQIEEVKKWIQAPVKVCKSYLENKEYLENIIPNLNTEVFLFIGEYRPPYDHKNIEFLIDIFNNLPEYTLIIIGKNTEKLKDKAKGNINIKGFVENKDEYYKEATYYIHLPKYEAGPITLLEAMTVGVIPITNKNAGHSLYVKKLAENLVLEGNETAQQAVLKIKEIEQKPLVWKQKIAETFKKNAQFHWDKEQQKKAFSNVWKAVIAEIEKK